MFRNKLWGIFLILLAFHSCSEEIIIDLPKQSSSLSINCLFSPIELPYVENLNVFISQSNAFLDTGNWISIENANVKLIYQDSTLTNFYWHDSIGRYFPVKTPFEYNLKEGEEYILEASFNDQIYRSNEQMPYKVIIEDCFITPYGGVNEEGFFFSRVTFSFKDPPGRANYYEIQLRRSPMDEESNYYITSDAPSIASEPYYPLTFSQEKPRPKYLPFTDKSFDGTTNQISIYYTPPTVNNPNIISGHHVFLLFKTVSENYYKYRTSLILQEYNRRENILFGMSEPLNVFSNIEGGYGIFAASTNDYFTIMIADSGKVYEN